MRDIKKARSDLLEIYHAGLKGVGGREAVFRHLDEKLSDVSLIALGKAAQAMTLGALDKLGGRIVDGLVISKAGHLDIDLLRKRGLEVIESSHPVPDERSLLAGQRLLQYIASLPEDRSLLFLISGGTSSLVEVLRESITLEQMRRANDWLLASGLSINTMNRLRRSLSVIKGGGLLRFIGRRPVELLLISDVPQDDPGVIGSGLLVSPDDADISLTGLELPEWLETLVTDESEQAVPDNSNVTVSIIACLRDAREAAAVKARELGYGVRVSHAHISADAVNAGRRLALELTDSAPGVFVWGGEPSVCLPDEPGRGGRNQHLALSAATVMAGYDDVCFLSIGTDGSDGPGEDAGALVDGGTIGRGQREGFEAEQCLKAADSGSFLEASGDLINTGPTGTNVMDLILGMKL